MHGQLIHKEGRIVIRLHYSIDIDAPRQRMWEVLWDEKTYRDWASAFMEVPISCAHPVG